MGRWSSRTLTTTVCRSLIRLSGISPWRGFARDLPLPLAGISVADPGRHSADHVRHGTAAFGGAGAAHGDPHPALAHFPAADPGLGAVGIHASRARVDGLLPDRPFGLGPAEPEGFVPRD